MSRWKKSGLIISRNSHSVRRQLRIIAFIPARGGSKGLSIKNVLNLGGKPLIAWAIEAAQKIPNIDRIVVSTEDNEISSIAKEFGAEAPFLRPASLASDDALLTDVISHTYAYLKEEQNYIPDVIVTLLPTSPFRPRSLILKLSGYIQKGYNVICCNEIASAHHQYWIPQSKQRMVPVDMSQTTNRNWYRQCGLFTGTHYGLSRPAPSYCHIVQDKRLMIDIDTATDMAQARQIVANNLFDPNE